MNDIAVLRFSLAVHGPAAACGNRALRTERRHVSADEVRALEEAVASSPLAAP